MINWVLPCDQFGDWFLGHLKLSTSFDESKPPVPNSFISKIANKVSHLVSWQLVLVVPC